MNLAKRLIATGAMAFAVGGLGFGTGAILNKEAEQQARQLIPYENAYDTNLFLLDHIRSRQQGYLLLGASGVGTSLAGLFMLCLGIACRRQEEPENGESVDIIQWEDGWVAKLAPVLPEDAGPRDEHRLENIAFQVAADQELNLYNMNSGRMYALDPSAKHLAIGEVNNRCEDSVVKERVEIAYRTIEERMQDAEITIGDEE